jgi:aryl-alcohol dehydrogenase-like predicted oxidoreductase
VSQVAEEITLAKRFIAVFSSCLFWHNVGRHRIGLSCRRLHRCLTHLITRYAVSYAIGTVLRTDAEYVKQACGKRLKRLDVSCIDLYYAHRVDGITPVELMVQAMKELRDEGKIRYLGLSVVSVSTLRRACKMCHISAVQMEYPRFAMQIEDPQIDLLRTARELGVAVVAYAPLGKGFLTGSVKSLEDCEEDDFRRGYPRYQGENFGKNLVLVKQLRGMAERKGCKVGQLTLAWEMAQGGDIIPIP